MTLATLALAGALALRVGASADPAGDGVPMATSELAATAAPSPPATTDRYSNIEVGDYVGPEVCGACHPENHRGWQASLHAGMNRRASDPGAVRGDFDGARLAYGGGIASFGRDGEDHVMTLAPAGRPTRRFRVTRTIGSRYLQEYVGVEVQTGDDGRDGTELRLPFGYWLRAQAWLPRPYFDSWYGPEHGADGALAVDPYRPDDAPWATRCAWCHNTYPFELRALRAAERAIGHGLEQYFDLAADRRDAASRAAIAVENRLPTDELVTVGISCESCHLGGREHAENDQDIRFVPSSPDLRPHLDAPDLAGGRENSVVVVAICAQCHSTPAPRFPDGAATRNSSEALDLAASPCAPAIKCTDCHDPHRSGPGAAAPAQPAHLAACTGCHQQLASPDVARAHAGHPDGAVTCLDCHMPRIVQGVSTMVRSHRISSPTDPEMLASAAPNACNLCHLDRSLTWTLDALDFTWGRHLTPAASWRRQYADGLDAPLGPQWLASASGTLRILAASAYARSPLGRAALPALIGILDDPVAYDRMWVLFAIEDVLGRRLTSAEYDPIAEPATRAAQARGLRERGLR